jgi:hypothetical protein
MQSAAFIDQLLHSPAAIASSCFIILELLLSQLIESAIAARHHRSNANLVLVHPRVEPTRAMLVLLFLFLPTGQSATPYDAAR